MKLITLYFYICERYSTTLICHCQRFGNRFLEKQPDFTDEEILTIYLFAIMNEEKRTVKSIYHHARKYWLDWFPKLPSYQSFSSRLNRLSDCFAVLIQCLIEDMDHSGVRIDCNLVDSMPIKTCSSKRKGKVALDLTDKGFCATKGFHYYGVKLHLIGQIRIKRIPIPEYIGITPASENDLNAIRPILHGFIDRKIFADKAYSDAKLNEELEKNQGTYIFTPVKLVKGQCQLIRDFDQANNDLFSTAVSTIRQPIESFFNWLQQKTNIEDASKVRSSKGLIVHCFGKIAAALALWVF